MATILSEEKRKMRLSISISKELISRIENERGDVSRSRFIEKLIRKGFDYLS